MSTGRPMSSLRRPMPGMPAAASPPPEQARTPTAAPARPRPEVRTKRPGARRAAADAAVARPGEASRERWMSADYSATRLANFRLPIDLYDHYRELVRQVEQSDPRLRRPSLTEVIIALLEEGPRTPHEVAELLRRRRAAENAQEASR
jgi:hypothetical protein